MHRCDLATASVVASGLMACARASLCRGGPSCDAAMAVGSQAVHSLIACDCDEVQRAALRRLRVAVQGGAWGTGDLHGFPKGSYAGGEERAFRGRENATRGFCAG